jgi:hypothetical protein
MRAIASPFFNASTTGRLPSNSAGCVSVPARSCSAKVWSIKAAG